MANPSVAEPYSYNSDYQIVQTKDAVLVHVEMIHDARIIPIDGRGHPDDINPTYKGDSVGHWEGDTLVVDVTDFNDETWFDRSGNFHSDELHVIERYTLVDADHINYEATIEDPKVFTRPWTMRMTLYRRKEKNFQLLEYECYGFAYEKLYP